jgi:hypothetical protein
MAGSFEHGNEAAGSIKVLGISLLVEELLASDEGLCCMELVFTDVFFLQFLTLNNKYTIVICDFTKSALQKSLYWQYRNGDCVL